MKKYLFIMIGFVLFLTSCEKESEGISKETQFAEFTMNGEQYMSIVKGATYTEPGVTAKEGDADLTVSTKGQVNTNQVGVYDIVYSAQNKDGYPGSVTRTVAVIPAAEVAGADISGTYFLDENATVTKYAPGFYYMSNIFRKGNAVPAYLISTDGKNIIIPEASLSGYGRADGTGTVKDNGDFALVISLLDQNPIFHNYKRNWVRK